MTAQASVRPNVNVDTVACSVEPMVCSCLSQREDKQPIDPLAIHFSDCALDLVDLQVSAMLDRRSETALVQHCSYIPLAC